MELTVYLLFGLLFAGVFATLIGGILVGVFMYKTKYAGDKFFTPAGPQGEAFVADGEFDDDFDLSKEPEKKYPEPVEQSIKAFEDQFGMNRMIKEAAKYQEQEPEEEEDAA